MLRSQQALGPPAARRNQAVTRRDLQLRRDAAGCDGWRAATWLLHELDGTPLPHAARNRAQRIACDGVWVPGDPYVE